MFSGIIITLQFKSQTFVTVSLQDIFFNQAMLKTICKFACDY